MRYAPLDRRGERYDPSYVELHSWARTALEIISGSESQFRIHGNWLVLTLRPEPPFHDLSLSCEVFEAKQKGETPTKEEHACDGFAVFPGLWDLLQSCWTVNTEDYPTAEAVLAQLSRLLAPSTTVPPASV